MYKLSDILLYPRELHGKLTDRKATLYAGILFIGIVDLFLPNFVETCKLFFSGKPVNEVLINILLSVGVVLLMGIIDVVAFCLPLFDFFKYLKNKAGEPHNATAPKVMKVYIASYFILVPVQIVLYYTLFRDISANSSQVLLNLYAIYLFVILLWSSAIVTRGINTLFNLNSILRKLSFVIILIWNLIIMIVFSYQVFPWILKVFLLTGVKIPS